ncbi:MAG: cell shape-determining protein MreC [Candidatus Paceibacteria bacterium]|jgi:cell shape-determining protein MreC
MSYIFARKKDNKTWKITTIVSIVVLIVIFRRPVLSLFGNGVSVVSGPVWGVSDFVSGGITESLLAIQSKKSLIKKLLDLQDDFMIMATLKKEKEVLENENARLMDLLGLYNSSVFDKTARVLSRPPKIAYDNILIDKGRKDDISSGSKAFTSGGIYIGTVKEVYLESSLVELLSTSGVETEARLSSADSSLSLILVGRGGGSFSVNVPRDVFVDESGLFVSSLNGEFLIAETSKVTGDPQDPIKTVIAKTPFNINYIDYVFIKN